MLKPSKLFGSDVYESYTAVYSFQSNQMAHAMMGFAGTALLTAAAYMAWDVIWPGFAFFLVPALKDLSDYTVDTARAEQVSRKSGSAAFPLTKLRKRELAQDGVTDTFFWSNGMILALFVAFLLTKPDWASMAMAGGAVVVVLLYGILVLGKRYLREKRSFDRSALPFLFRLPNFVGRFDPESRENGVKAIQAFLKDRDCPPVQHVVITGPQGSGKTTLAVGIGSGLTVNREPFSSLENLVQVARWIFVPRHPEELPKVRYTSFATLVETLESDPRDGPVTEGEPWPIRKADVLLIDDVFDGAAQHLPADLAALTNKRCVWVLSDPTGGPSWQALIKDRVPTAKDEVFVAELAKPEPIGKPEFGLTSLPGLLSGLALAFPAGLALSALYVLLRVAEWFPRSSTVGG